MKKFHFLQRKQNHVFVSLILYVVLFLRPLLFLVTMAIPEGSITLDSNDYILLARAIRFEGRYSTAVSGVDLIRPPGYPLFLTPFLDAQGINHELVVLTQLILVSGASLVIFRQLKRFGYPTVGLVAALFIGLSANIALWSMTIMSESLFTVLVVISALQILKALQDQQFFYLFISGLLLGLATLTRPIGLILVVIWSSLYVALVSRSDRMRSHVSQVVLIIFGFLLVTLPWVFRNYFIYGDITVSPVGVNTIESFNFAIVLSEATGVSRNQATQILAEYGGTRGQFLWIVKTYPYEFIRGQVFGVMRVLGGSELSRWATILGIDQWSGFGIFRNLLVFKLRDMVRAFVELFARSSNVLLLIIMCLGAVHTIFLLSFALIGFLRRGLLPTFARRIIWLSLVTSLALILVTGAAGQARFRVPAEPFLAVLAGFGVNSSRRNPEQDHLTP